MYIHVTSLLWILNYLTAIARCEDESRSSAPTRYTWHHFDTLETSQWLTTHSAVMNDSNITYTLSCALAMPSLCIYRVASEPMPTAFHIFYNHEMYPFLLDRYWTSIAATNNLDTDILHTLSRKKQPKKKFEHIASSSSSSSSSGGGGGGRRSLLQYDHGDYDGYGYGNRYRHRRCHSIKCRMGKTLGRMARHIRLESRIRHKMYKVGVKVGQAMRKKNPWKLFQACLMTRICVPRRRRMPRPRTYVSFLGRPRVVSTSHYVTSYSPMSYSPGMMAAGAPQLVGHPANSLLGRHRYFRRRRMLSTPDLDGHDFELYDDVRLKKCTQTQQSESQPLVEICATVYYYDAARVTVDVYEMEVARSNDTDTRYEQLHVWTAATGGGGVTGEGEGEKLQLQCNDEVLAWIGYRVCLQVDREKNDVLALITNDQNELAMTPMYTWSLQHRRSTEWSKLYRVENAGMKREKICRDVDRIEICFEMTFEASSIDKVEVSTQRIVVLRN